jgi:hypothetical protein
MYRATTKMTVWVLLTVSTPARQVSSERTSRARAIWEGILRWENHSSDPVFRWNVKRTPVEEEIMISESRSRGISIYHCQATKRKDQPRTCCTRPVYWCVASRFSVEAAGIALDSRGCATARCLLVTLRPRIRASILEQLCTSTFNRRVKTCRREEHSRIAAFR